MKDNAWLTQGLLPLILAALLPSGNVFGDAFFFRVNGTQPSHIDTLIVKETNALVNWTFATAGDQQQVWYCTSIHPEAHWHLFWDADETTMGNHVDFVVPLTNIDLSRNLLAFYRLNGDGTDQTTNAFHGTVAGSTVATTNRHGVSGRAMFFNRADSFINLNVPVLDTTNYDHEMTLASWINPLNVEDDNWVLCQYLYDPNESGRFTWGLSNGKIRYFRGGHAIFSSTEITPNQWVHIAVTKDASGHITHYLNGQPDGTGTLRGAFCSAPTLIGGGVFSGYNFLFHGAIDDLRIFQRELSAEEIRRLWLCK